MTHEDEQSECKTARDGLGSKGNTVTKEVEGELTERTNQDGSPKSLLSKEKMDIDQDATIAQPGDASCVHTEPYDQQELTDDAQAEGNAMIEVNN